MTNETILVLVVYSFDLESLFKPNNPNYVFFNSLFNYGTLASTKFVPIKNFPKNFDIVSEFESLADASPYFGVIDISNVLTSRPCVICHSTYQRTAEYSEVTSSFATIDLITWITICIYLIIGSFFCSKKDETLSFNEVFFNLIRLLVSQVYTAGRSKIRSSLVLVLTLLMVFYIHALFSANFSTSLTISKPAPAIKTFDDISDWDFLEARSEHWTCCSISIFDGKVGNTLRQMSPKMCQPQIELNTLDALKFITNYKIGQYLVLTPLARARSWKFRACSEYYNNIHLSCSKPYHETNLVSGKRWNMSDAKKRIIQRTTYSYIEMGFNFKVESSNFERLYSLGNSINCLKNVDTKIDDYSDETQSFPLYFYHNLLKFNCLCIIICFAVFIKEKYKKVAIKVVNFSMVKDKFRADIF